jgi:pimeloyl-ACP methyl ester carboxylesterase
MSQSLSSGIALALLTMLTTSSAMSGERRIEIPLGSSGNLPVAELISALARASGVSVDRPEFSLTLPTRGLGGSLTRTLLAECLGADADFAFRRDSVAILIDEEALGEAHRSEWKQRLDDLADRSKQASRRQQFYGMRARPSYRPNDAGRPTVCLVHGLNSSSGGFVHMFDDLEDAGYGLVVFDYPFNQRLDDSCAQFLAEWRRFRTDAGETRPWAILAHSMGALVARSYVEGDDRANRDIASLIMVAPVNQGAHVARLQPVYQTLSSLFAINSKRTTHALAQLSDGIGQAAEDLLPGSAFLRRLNGRARSAGVPYHILAGDGGLISREVGQQARARLDAASRDAGLFGVFTSLAGREVGPLLEELTDGSGDGCVAVERTRLAGVDDHVTIRANHAELIRAPLLFADDGPVPCMPQVLRWLREDLSPVPR